MVTLFQALNLILNVIWFVMIAHIIMSWLINFQVLNLRQPLVAFVVLIILQRALINNAGFFYSY